MSEIEIEIVCQDDEATTDAEIESMVEDSRDLLAAHIRANSSDDHLQKCNSCGHVRRHSDQTPCPNGEHGRAGWSYAGPIPEPGTAVFIEPPSDTDAWLEEHFAGIDVHESVIKGTFDALLSVGHTEPQAREVIGKALYTGRQFSSVSEMMDAIYNPGSEIPDAGAEPEEEGPPESELADDPTSIAVEKAIMRMFEVQDRLDAAVEDHAEKADVAKTAKKRVESLQEDLSVAVKAVREARSAGDPDPDKFPLFDRPKEETFSGFGSKP